MIQLNRSNQICPGLDEYLVCIKKNNNNIFILFFNNIIILIDGVHESVPFITFVQ
jgi:hypothetical protein